MAAVQCSNCQKDIPLRPNPNEVRLGIHVDERTPTIMTPDGMAYICLECVEVKKAEAIERGEQLVNVDVAPGDASFDPEKEALKAKIRELQAAAPQQQAAPVGGNEVAG